MPYDLTAEHDARWKQLARDGERVQAIRLHREVTGADLIESRNAVEEYWQSLPESERSPAMEVDEMELGNIFVQLAEQAASGDEHVDRFTKRQAKIAKEVLDAHFRRDEAAQTGPVPPRRQKFAEHHWLHSPSRGVVVMQWQPARRAWCPSGGVGSLSSVDTTGWQYIAPCPMPMLEDEVEQLRHIARTIRDGAMLSLTDDDKAVLLTFVREHFANPNL